jgi:hypothetical protein
MICKNRVSRGRMIWLLAHHLPSPSTREVENISGGPILRDFVTILAEGSMQAARLQSTRVQTPLSPSIKFNVLSLRRQSKYSFCNTKEKGVVDNLYSIYVLYCQ